MSLTIGKANKSENTQVGKARASSNASAVTTSDFKKKLTELFFTPNAILKDMTSQEYSTRYGLDSNGNPLSTSSPGYMLGTSVESTQVQTFFTTAWGILQFNNQLAEKLMSR
jgi:hypothetical protein